MVHLQMELSASTRVRTGIQGSVCPAIASMQENEQVVQSRNIHSA